MHNRSSGLMNDRLWNVIIVVFIINEQMLKWFKVYPCGLRWDYKECLKCLASEADNSITALLRSQMTQQPSVLPDTRSATNLYTAINSNTLYDLSPQVNQTTCQSVDPQLDLNFQVKPTVHGLSIQTHATHKHWLFIRGLYLQNCSNKACNSKLFFPCVVEWLTHWNVYWTSIRHQYQSF